MHPDFNPLVRMSFDAHLKTKENFRVRCEALETTMADRLRVLMELDLGTQDADEKGASA